jgi:integrase
MAKIKITKRSVETLKVTSKDYIAFDTELPGFGVRVMPSGKRFFLVQYRRHGRTRRVMIGQFGVVTAELARREATIKLGSVRGANGDPAALRDAERQSLTMKQLGERFLTQYVPARCKPSTEAEYRRAVELFLDPFFAKQHVRSVTTADVAELHGSLSHIPYQANRTLGVLSKMMNLAETWGIRDKHTNPCEDVERYPERKRERFLSPKELKRLGHALAAAEAEQTETKYAVAAFRILLLTGCRLSEIQKLEWRYVDLAVC